MKTASKWRWPKNEKDLKKDDGLKNKEDHKIKDNLKNEDNVRKKAISKL